MSDILVTPPVLRSTASQLRDHALRVRQFLQKADTDIQALAPVRFEGNRANGLRTRYRSTREKIFTWPELLARFSVQLVEIADVFEKADRNGAGTPGGSDGSVGVVKPPVIVPVPSDSKPVPSTAENDVTPINYDKNAPAHDCVAFVTHHRSVPSGFNNKQGGFYTGIYKGQSGTLSSGYEYGQEPKIGSIMTESPSGTNGIKYGHASYVIDVTKDESGNVTGYRIAEGSWPKGSLHEETFTWDTNTNQYVSSTGKRSPDMFVY
jgi:uncharacterized protein YukE/surface antigen